VKWDLSKFALTGKKSGQWWLKLKIEELVPGIEILEDYQHPELTWGAFLIPYYFFTITLFEFALGNNSDRNVELDLWIPAYRIGIEFQGTALSVH
jgi:hypothetical protein